MSDRTTSPYDGTLERTTDGGVIRFERHVAYPIREVWDAITNPTRLADWWLPFDADITVDLREGGQMVFAAIGDEPITITCTILRVEPPMLLEHTHVDPGSYMRWELEPVETGCILRLRGLADRAPSVAPVDEFGGDDEDDGERELGGAMPADAVGVPS